jgi:hypothetical protein
VLNALRVKRDNVRSHILEAADFAGVEMFLQKRNSWVLNHGYAVAFYLVRSRPIDDGTRST